MRIRAVKERKLFKNLYKNNKNKNKTRVDFFISFEKGLKRKTFSPQATQNWAETEKKKIVITKRPYTYVNACMHIYISIYIRERK